MAKLTEDQQRAFGDRILEIYGAPDTAAAVAKTDKGLNLAKRIAVLTAKQDAATKAEANQTQKKAEWMEATDLSQAATGDYYTEASSAAEALISELGEDAHLSHQLRQLRGGMINEAARGAKTAPTGTAPVTAKP